MLAVGPLPSPPQPLILYRLLSLTLSYSPRVCLSASGALTHLGDTRERAATEARRGLRRGGVARLAGRDN
jgi:hypothetical protein